MQKIPFQDVVELILSSPNTVSRKPIYEQYDKNVQGKTLQERGKVAASITMPFVDFPELKGHDRALTGVAIGTGGNPYLGRINAQAAAEYAIVTAALKVACVGGQFLGATDCLNFGNPEKPDQMAELVDGIEGVKMACTQLDIPIVSGNVSLYNESGTTSIPPSALVSVFARVDDPKMVPKTALKSGDTLFLVGTRSDDFGGSQLARSLEIDTTSFAPLDYEMIGSILKKLQTLSTQGVLTSALPVLSGGALMSLLEGCFEGGVGAEIIIDDATDLMPICFNENWGVVIAGSDESLIQETFGDQVIVLGTVVEEGLNIKAGGEEVYNISDLSDLQSSWANHLRSAL